MFPYLDFWTCGNCYQVYFKISILTCWKVNIFWKMLNMLSCKLYIVRNCNILLEFYLFCWFQSLPAGCVCVRAACGASATSEKTCPWMLEDVFCGFCDFKAILRPPGKMFIISPICSNDYAGKTRIAILCKKTCCIAPHFFSKLDFLGNS